MYKYVEKSGKISCPFPLFREERRMRSRYYLDKSKEAARIRTPSFHIPVLPGKMRFNGMRRENLLPRFQRVVFAVESTRSILRARTRIGTRLEISRNEFPWLSCPAQRRTS